MTVHPPAAQAKTASVALIHNWPLTLLSGLLLPVLLGLGLWQLQRAEEKAQLNAAIDARLSAQPREPAGLDALQAYMPVRLSGYYRDEIRYLDNRTRNGRVGYEILQLFVSGKERWLVNRGWVPAGADRGQLPEVAWPRVAKVITGFLYPLDDTGEVPAGPRVQSANRALGRELALARPAWSVRLSADSDTALVTGWQLVNSPPQRHTAYAVQWFAMAAALLLLWLFAATNLPRKLRKKYRACPQADSD
ncbi:SURF1 family protein [Microbulbifer sp.]|uniref:SURF1 family protein n=1 Tax=Microbulbifer sp. TaxID=1908541 RepID=UPI003F357136